MTGEKMFDRIALIGIGLIGSSLARVIRRQRLVGFIRVMRACRIHHKMTGILLNAAPDLGNRQLG